MIIEPPYLDQYPQTWISSIYTKSKQEHRTLQTKLSSNQYIHIRHSKHQSKSHVFF